MLQYIVLDEDRTYFPTIIVCSKCGGVTGICTSYSNGKYHPAITVNDKELALKIALVQHGYLLKTWEGKNVANKKFIPFKCTCAEPVLKMGD